jgi:predicted small lipoprotein YifL
MKKIAALILALLMVLSLAACGEKTAPEGSDTPASTTTEPAGSDTPDSEPKSTVCTPEAYDAAIDALTVTTGAPKRTYDDVVALFGGVEGIIDKDTEYEGYSYYNWTDGTRTALVTFKVKGEEETYFAITGDIQ